MRLFWCFVGFSGLAAAACPYMDTRADIHQRDDASFQTDGDFLKQFTVDDSDAFLTSDVGGPIQDDLSLKAGERGPTLLEDFIFRQKITHFDHERVSGSRHGYLGGLLTAKKGP
jgi:catalase